MSQFMLSRDVRIHRSEDQTGVVLDLNGQFYAANDSALDLLDALTSATTQAWIDRQAPDDFERESIRRDVESFTLEQLQNGVLCQSETGVRGAELRCRPLLESVLRGCLRLGWVPGVLFCLRQMIARTGFGNTVRRCTELTQHDFRSVAEPESIARLTAERVLRQVARSVCRLDCKEIALGTYVLCRQRGVLCQLHVGVSATPLTSHTWVTFNGAVLTDFEDRCARLSVVATFPEEQE